jgi:hypothetical protein
MKNMFANCICSSSPFTGPIVDGHLDVKELNDQVDACLQNLVGGEAAVGLAQRWTDDWSVKKKLEGMRRWLDGWARIAVDRVLDLRIEGASSPIRRRMSRESDEETDDADDERGKTAHILFAQQGEEGNRWSRSSSSQMMSTPKKMQEMFPIPVSSPLPLSERIRTKRKPISSLPLSPCNRRPEPLSDVNNVIEGGNCASDGTHIQIQAFKKQKVTVYGNATENIEVPGSSPSIKHPDQSKPFLTSRIPTPSESPDQVSPETAARRAFRKRRLQIGEKLCLARPDLVSPTYLATRSRLLSRHLKSEARDEYMRIMHSISVDSVGSFEMMDVNGEGIDPWKV